jgi:hypothetical protein
MVGNPDGTPWSARGSGEELASGEVLDFVLASKQRCLTGRGTSNLDADFDLA